MTTIVRHDDSLDPLRSATSELLSAACDACLDFLRVELKLAQTLLDMAANARGEPARGRRIALAEQALSVVRRFIAAPPPLVRIPDDERERLASELGRVNERLTVMS